MRKFFVAAALSLFALAACESNIPGLDEIETDLRAQLNVDRVECLTPNDTISVGLGVSCVAYNAQGAELSFEGYAFTVGGWSVLPDSLAIITIQGIVTGTAPGAITVRADGTDGTFGEKVLTVIP